LLVGDFYRKYEAAADSGHYLKYSVTFANPSVNRNSAL